MLPYVLIDNKKVAPFKSTKIPPYGPLANTTEAGEYTVAQMVRINGKDELFIWPSSEHAYHAQKIIYILGTLRPDQHKKRKGLEAALYKIVNTKNRPGEQFLPREDFDPIARSLLRQHRIDINANHHLHQQFMRNVLELKLAQHPKLMKLVKDCAEQGIMLIEASAHDNTWASGLDGMGKNQLGILLLEIGNDILRFQNGNPKIDNPREHYKNLQRQNPSAISHNELEKKLKPNSDWYHKEKVTVAISKPKLKFSYAVDGKTIIVKHSTSDDYWLKVTVENNIPSANVFTKNHVDQGALIIQQNTQLLQTEFTEFWDELKNQTIHLEIADKLWNNKSVDEYSLEVLKEFFAWVLQGNCKTILSQIGTPSCNFYSWSRKEGLEKLRGFTLAGGQEEMRADPGAHFIPVSIQDIQTSLSEYQQTIDSLEKYRQRLHEGKKLFLFDRDDTLAHRDNFAIINPGVMLPILKHIHENHVLFLASNGGGKGERPEDSLADGGFLKLLTEGVPGFKPHNDLYLGEMKKDYRLIFQEQLKTLELDYDEVVNGAAIYRNVFNIKIGELTLIVSLDAFFTSHKDNGQSIFTGKTFRMLKQLSDLKCLPSPKMKQKIESLPGIKSIFAPEDFYQLADDQVVFLDDENKNVVAAKNNGFVSIQADTQSVLDGLIKEASELPLFSSRDQELTMEKIQYFTNILNKRSKNGEYQNRVNTFYKKIQNLPKDSKPEQKILSEYNSLVKDVPMYIIQDGVWALLSRAQPYPNFLNQVQSFYNEIKGIDPNKPTSSLHLQQYNQIVKAILKLVAKNHYLEELLAQLPANDHKAKDVIRAKKLLELGCLGDPRLKQPFDKTGAGLGGYTETREKIFELYKDEPSYILDMLFALNPGNPFAADPNDGAAYQLTSLLARNNIARVQNITIKDIVNYILEKQKHDSEQAARVFNAFFTRHDFGVSRFLEMQNGRNFRAELTTKPQLIQQLLAAASKNPKLKQAIDSTEILLTKHFIVSFNHRMEVLRAFVQAKNLNNALTDFDQATTDKEQYFALRALCARQEFADRKDLQRIPQLFLNVKLLQLRKIVSENAIDLKDGQKTSQLKLDMDQFDLAQTDWEKYFCLVRLYANAKELDPNPLQGAKDLSEWFLLANLDEQVTQEFPLQELKTEGERVAYHRYLQQNLGTVPDVLKLRDSEKSILQVPFNYFPEQANHESEFQRGLQGLSSAIVDRQIGTEQELKGFLNAFSINLNYIFQNAADVEACQARFKALINVFAFFQKLRAIPAIADPTTNIVRFRDAKNSLQAYLALARLFNNTKELCLQELQQHFYLLHEQAIQQQILQNQDLSQYFVKNKLKTEEDVIAFGEYIDIVLKGIPQAEDKFARLLELLNNAPEIIQSKNLSKHEELLAKAIEQIILSHQLNLTSVQRLQLFAVSKNNFGAKLVEMLEKKNENILSQAINNLNINDLPELYKLAKAGPHYHPLINYALKNQQFKQNAEVYKFLVRLNIFHQSCDNLSKANRNNDERYSQLIILRSVLANMEKFAQDNVVYQGSFIAAKAKYQRLLNSEQDSELTSDNINAAIHALRLQFPEDELDLTIFPQNIQQLETNKRLVIGDLHSNALKLIYVLIQKGIITEINQAQYEQTVRIYYTPVELLDQADIQQFKDIINNCRITCPENSLITLIGDIFRDRGSNDKFVRILLNRLQTARIDYDPHWSNHDLLAISAWDQLGKGDIGSVLLDPSDEQSFLNDHALIQAGLATKEEANQEFEAYRTKLKLVSYGYTANGKELVFYVHGLVGTVTISRLAKELGVTYEDATPKELAETIDKINQAFAAKYKDRDELVKFCQQFPTRKNFQIDAYNELNGIIPEDNQLCLAGEEEADKKQIRYCFKNATGKIVSGVVTGSDIDQTYIDKLLEMLITGNKSDSMDGLKNHPAGLALLHFLEKQKGLVLPNSLSSNPFMRLCWSRDPSEFGVLPDFVKVVCGHHYLTPDQQTQFPQVSFSDNMWGRAKRSNLGLRSSIAASGVLVTTDLPTNAFAHQEQAEPIIERIIKLQKSKPEEAAKVFTHFFRKPTFTEAIRRIFSFSKKPNYRELFWQSPEAVVNLLKVAGKEVHQAIADSKIMLSSHIIKNKPGVMQDLDFAFIANAKLLAEKGVNKLADYLAKDLNGQISPEQEAFQKLRLSEIVEDWIEKFNANAELLVFQNDDLSRWNSCQPELGSQPDLIFKLLVGSNQKLFDIVIQKVDLITALKDHANIADFLPALVNVMITDQQKSERLFASFAEKLAATPNLVSDLLVKGDFQLMNSVLANGDLVAVIPDDKLPGIVQAIIADQQKAPQLLQELADKIATKPELVCQLLTKCRGDALNLVLANDTLKNAIREEGQFNLLVAMLKRDPANAEQILDAYAEQLMQFPILVDQLMDIPNEKLFTKVFERLRTQSEKNQYIVNDDPKTLCKVLFECPRGLFEQLGNDARREIINNFLKNPLRAAQYLPLFIDAMIQHPEKTRFLFACCAAALAGQPKLVGELLVAINNNAELGFILTHQPVITPFSDYLNNKDDLKAFVNELIKRQQNAQIIIERSISPQLLANPDILCKLLVKSRDDLFNFIIGIEPFVLKIKENLSTLVNALIADTTNAQTILPRVKAELITQPQLIIQMLANSPDMNLFNYILNDDDFVNAVKTSLDELVNIALDANKLGKIVETFSAELIADPKHIQRLLVKSGSRNIAVFTTVINNEAFRDAARGRFAEFGAELVNAVIATPAKAELFLQHFADLLTAEHIHQLLVNGNVDIFNGVINNVELTEKLRPRFADFAASLADAVIAVPAKAQLFLQNFGEALTAEHIHQFLVKMNLESIAVFNTVMGDAVFTSRLRPRFADFAALLVDAVIVVPDKGQAFFEKFKVELMENPVLVCRLLVKGNAALCQTLMSQIKPAGIDNDPFWNLQIELKKEPFISEIKKAIVVEPAKKEILTKLLFGDYENAQPFSLRLNNADVQTDDHKKFETRENKRAYKIFCFYMDKIENKSLAKRLKNSVKPENYSTHQSVVELDRFVTAVNAQLKEATGLTWDTYNNNAIPNKPVEFEQNRFGTKPYKSEVKAPASAAVPAKPAATSKVPEEKNQWKREYYDNLKAYTKLAFEKAGEVRISNNLKTFLGFQIANVNAADIYTKLQTLTPKEAKVCYKLFAVELRDIINKGKKAIEAEIPKLSANSDLFTVDENKPTLAIFASTSNDAAQAAVKCGLEPVVSIAANAFKQGGGWDHQGTQEEFGVRSTVNGCSRLAEDICGAENYRANKLWQLDDFYSMMPAYPSDDELDKARKTNTDVVKAVKEKKANEGKDKRVAGMYSLHPEVSSRPVEENKHPAVYVPGVLQVMDDKKNMNPDNLAKVSWLALAAPNLKSSIFTKDPFSDRRNYYGFFNSEREKDGIKKAYQNIFEAAIDAYLAVNTTDVLKKAHPLFLVAWGTGAFAGDALDRDTFITNNIKQIAAGFCEALVKKADALKGVFVCLPIFANPRVFNAFQEAVKQAGSAISDKFEIKPERKVKYELDAINGVNPPESFTTLSM